MQNQARGPTLARMTDTRTKRQKSNVDTRHQRVELRPLPLRITQHQFQRLIQLRAFDEIPIQEHVRRALDFYLEDMDRRLAVEKLAYAERDALISESAQKSAVQSTSYSTSQTAKVRAGQPTGMPPSTASEVLARALQRAPRPKVGIR